MVVVFGAVVVVFGAVVGEVVDAVVVGVVVDAPVVGTLDVGTGGAATVVEVAVPLFTRSFNIAVMAAEGGFGIDAPARTKATVMSWPSARRTELASVCVTG